MTPDNPTQSEMEPCPWCRTERREIHDTAGGRIGVIWHELGCYLAPHDDDRRQVLTPSGIKAWNSRAPVVAPQKDLRIYDREGNVVTQGAFNALMAKMDSLTEDAELATEDADRLRGELGDVYANMLREGTRPDAPDDKCVLCGHDRRTYNVEADACEHATGLTQPQFDVFCGCACRFTAAPLLVQQEDALKAAQDFAFLIHRSLHNTETEFHECELGVCRRARSLTAPQHGTRVPRRHAYSSRTRADKYRAAVPGSQTP